MRQQAGWLPLKGEKKMKGGIRGDGKSVLKKYREERDNE